MPCGFGVGIVCTVDPLTRTASPGPSAFTRKTDGAGPHPFQCGTNCTSLFVIADPMVQFVPH